MPSPVRLAEVAAYMDDLLRVTDYDEGEPPNGLMLDAARPVRRIAAAAGRLLPSERLLSSTHVPSTRAASSRRSRQPRGGTVRIFMMTDQEGVAGVVDWDWADANVDQAKRLLTLEVNAAAEGFFEAGAASILVVDGHGQGGINPELLDERVEFLRGWGKRPSWPLHLDEGFDFLAFVGQHAKAGTEYGHLTHTQSVRYVDLAINGVSIGEFGQLVLCASELGVRAIFGAGDLAFTKEAEGFVPGIETVWVKRGLSPGSGDELDEEAYRTKNRGAIHRSVIQARRLIRAGAVRALRRAQAESFGIVPLTPPFERVARFRPNKDRPYPTVSRETHPTSVIAAMNLPYEPVRVQEG